MNQLPLNVKDSSISDYDTSKANAKLASKGGLK
jgi:hypothetical protein